MFVSLEKLGLSCVSLIAITALSACGGGGGGGSSSPPPAADILAPTVTFSPRTLTVASGETGTSTLTARDNVGVVSGPTVTCTNGGSFSANVFTAPEVSETTTSVCTARATDAAGNIGSTTLTVTIPAPEPDTTAPVVTFSPTTLSVQSGGTGSSTLTATDDVGVDEGPTVVCTNNGSFANNTFTAPTVTTDTTSICTATASDAAGNSAEATLTVAISPQTSEFFRTVSDTITIDPVLGFFELPNDPSILAGVTKSASGAVSLFAATNTGIGTYDDAVLTAQPTLGTVGTAPLDLLFADLTGFEGNNQELVFLDEINDLLIGSDVNPSNEFGTLRTQSVGNLCDAGRGSGTQFVGGSGPNRTRDDILVGTTNGLFYVSAGFANDGVTTSGFSSPSPIVPTGNFCALSASPTGPGDTSYTVFDATTASIKGFEGEADDASSYEEQFSFDLSSSISPNTQPILFEATYSASSASTVFSVFDAQSGTGSTVIISDVGVTPDTAVVNLDLESPTDILLITRGLSEDAIIVSPTSQYAVYIRNANRTTRTVELIDIGLGYDQVEFAGGAVAFGSSTQNNIVIRSLQ